MSLRGFATLNIWAADIPATATWYAEFLEVDPYFTRWGFDGMPVYVEFCIGDYQAEMGIVDRRFAPAGAKKSDTTPRLRCQVARSCTGTSTTSNRRSLGAVEYEPITRRGDAGFVTASLVDPAGNILGLMSNPHYLEILESGHE
ncbi:VOC family protein [Corynebacterium glyciniphilum]|uniref:VOC family protein n=1 Tax=Corynebacterium glyciniphilum TaxID=1404244 RepID=UPI003FD4D368